MSSIAYTLQHLLGRLNEELFPEHEMCKHTVRRRGTTCIRFASRRRNDTEEHANGAK